MKTVITFLRSKLLLVCWLIASTARAGTFSSYAPTNKVNGPDLLLMDAQTNVSPAYKTMTVTASNLVNSDLNSSNRFMQHLTLSDNSNYVAFAGTVSSTNGNDFLLLSSAVDMLKITVGDQLVGPGGQQYHVTGITNANQTLAVNNSARAVNTQVAATGFLLYFKSITLRDSQPVTQGGIGGNGLYSVASFSTGNNGGVSVGYTFNDGISSGGLYNNGASPFNYLSLSIGGMRGVNNGTQVIIEDTSHYGNLTIHARDELGTRGKYTNDFANYHIFENPVSSSNFITSRLDHYSSNSIAGVGTVSGTLNGCVVTANTGGAFSAVTFGWSIFIGSVTYHVTQVTDSTHLLIYPASLGTFSGLAYTLIPPSDLGYNNTQVPAEASTWDGALMVDCLGGPAGYIMAAGTNSARFQIVNEVDGWDVELQRAFGGVPWSVNLAAPFGSFAVLADGETSIKGGLTNGGGGAVVVNGGLRVASGLLTIGAATNVASFTLVNTNWIDGGTYTNTTGRNIYVWSPLHFNNVAGTGDYQLIVTGTTTNRLQWQNNSATLQLSGSVSAIVPTNTTFTWTNAGTDPVTMGGGQYIVY